MRLRVHSPDLLWRQELLSRELPSCVKSTALGPKPGDPQNKGAGIHADTHNIHVHVYARTHTHTQVTWS